MKLHVFCPAVYHRAKGTRRRKRTTSKAGEKEAKTARKTTEKRSL